MRSEPNYLYRLTALFGIAELAQVCNIQMVKTHFIPILKEMSKD